MRQAAEQAGTKLFEQAEEVVFEVSQAVLLLVHPRTQRACQRGHAFGHSCNQLFSSGSICGRIHVNLRWVG